MNTRQRRRVKREANLTKLPSLQESISLVASIQVSYFPHSYSNISLHSGNKSSIQQLQHREYGVSYGIGATGTLRGGPAYSAVR
jgi:hypothetical protein